MARAPNLLLIFTDMQRWDTIHALGNPIIRTPSWDRLVREGAAFASCYSPSPVCVSARYAMHYGRWPSATGVTENVTMPPDAGDSVAALLARAGYRTHAVGKLHFTPDPHALRGFASRDTQEEIVARPERDDYLRYLVGHGYGHICDPHGARGEMYYIPQIAQMPAEHHPTRWVGDRAIDFIRAQGAQTPWMLMASFIHPHPPFAPPNPWHKLYRSYDMPLPHMPAEREALLSWVNRLQNRYKYRDQGFDQHLLRLMKAYYYACISFVDAQIGRLVHALAESGELDHTLILVTSDHGEFLGDLGCFGKRSMHDPSARVPLVARFPRSFAANQRVADPVSLIDVPVTLLGAAGAAGAEGMHGVDLARVARGDATRTHVFSHCGSGKAASYMALDARWKYIYSAPDAKEWLFDRSCDPLESRNRIALPSMRGVGAELRRRMLDHLDACQAREAVETTAEHGRRFVIHERLEIPSDPDAGLLVQDHPWAIQDIEGYTDVAPPALARWRLLGPFDAAQASGRLIDHPLPEEAAVLAGEAHAASAAGAGGGGAAASGPAWRAGAAGADGVVDLGALWGERARALALAVTEFDSPQERDAELECGSDDGIALWLNGVLVHRHESARGCSVGDDRVRVRLRAGVNRLVAKVSNLAGGWAFGVRVR